MRACVAGVLVRPQQPSLRWRPAGSGGRGLGRERSEELLVSIDRNENGARLVAPRDHKLIGLSLLNAVERLREFARCGTGREDLVEANTQHRLSLVGVELAPSSFAGSCGWASNGSTPRCFTRRPTIKASTRR
jgi:hypothetical protein